MNTETIAGYVLFAGEDYYPRGGWLDFKSEHETLEDALAEARRLTTASDAVYPESAAEANAREERVEHISWFQIVSVVWDTRYTTPACKMLSYVCARSWSEATLSHQWVERSGFVEVPA